MDEQKNTATTGIDSSKVFKREACLSRINSLITHKHQLMAEIGRQKPVNTQTAMSPYLALEQAFQEAIYVETGHLLSLK